MHPGNSLNNDGKRKENAAKLDTFKRGFAACMDARGYSVKQRVPASVEF
jgi:hypothetical protein